MKRSNSKSIRGSHFLLVSSATVAVLSLVHATQAQTLTWNGTGQGSPAGGSGIWDTTTGRWYDGTANQVWPNTPASTALLAGASGYILGGSAVTAGSLMFGANYTLYNPGTSVSTLTLGSGVIDTGANRVEILNPLAGTSGVTKDGSGYLIFHGSSGSNTGDWKINAGTFAFGNTAVAGIPNLSRVTVGAGANFDFAPFGGAYSDTIGMLDGTGNVQLGSAAGRGSSFTGSTVTTGNTATSSFSGTGTFSGSIGGAGGRYSKNGYLCEQTFTGTNTYTGATFINGGTLTLSSGNAVSDQSAVLLTNATSGAPVGALNSVLNINANETIGALGSGVAAANTGTQTYSLQVNLNSASLTIGADNVHAQFQAIIAGTGRVIKVGTGVQQFTQGAAVSTYTDGTEIRNGILLVSNDAKLGAASGSIMLNGGALSNFASGTTGTSLTHNRDVLVDTIGGSIQVLNNDQNARTTTLTGTVTGSGKLSKKGPGVLALNTPTQSFSGGLAVEEGVVSTNSTTSTVFGTGTIDLKQGELRITPTAGTADISLVAATGSSAALRYGPGAQINLNKNGNNSLSLTVGDSAAASSSLIRNSNGTLVIIPGATTGVASLGLAGGEKLLVTGGVGTLNGIVSPSIMAWTANGSSSGNFLSYDATNGFVNATYSALLDINSADNTTVFDATASTSNTLGADHNVYALRVAGSQTIGGTGTLTIGNGSGAAGLILNGISGGSSQIATAGLKFDGSDAVIFSQNTNAGTISAPITITGSGGLVKNGLGAITLTAPASYSGRTTIAGGVIQLNINDALPTTTDLVFAGNPSTAAATATNNSTLRLSGANQTVNSLSSTNSFALIDLGSSSLTVNQNTNTVFHGTIQGASGTLVKKGSGELDMNPFIGASYSTTALTQFVSGYQKLRVEGGTFTLQSFNSLPVLPAALLADCITLDGGTLKWKGVSTVTTTLGTFQSFSSFRGVTLGTGGGTIEITNPLELVLYQKSNAEVLGTDDRAVFSGSGDLIKTGAGVLRLGTGNTYTGRTILRGGWIQFQTDDAATPGTTAGNTLGATPSSPVADGIIFDGGGLWVNGSGIINANRGIYVTANNGTLATGTTAINGNYTINSSISGPGTLYRVGAGQVRFLAPNTVAAMNIQHGSTFFDASGSGGSGVITINPQFDLVFGKTSGTGSTVLNNNIVLGAGSTIELRVNSQTAGADTLELTGAISGPNGFYRNGSAVTTTQNAGTLILSGTGSSFGGTAVLQSGTTVVKSNSALGSISGPTIVNAGGALVFDGGVNYSTPEPLFVSGNGLATGGVGALLSTGAANTFAGPVVVAGAATVNLASDLTLSAGVRGASDLTVTGAAALDAAGIRVNALSVNNPKVSIATGRSTAKTSKIITLNLGANTLDLGDNDLVVSNTTDTAIGALITTAYAPAGDWSGAGITSSVAALGANKNKALGYGGASDVLGAGPYPLSFRGVSVDSAADVLVRYTYRGDINLDGQVSSTDFNSFVAGYGATAGSLWKNGDFDYDGKVNTIDFNYLAGNFGAAPIASALPDAGSSLGSVVPEPSSLSLLALGVAGIAARRRRA